MKVKLFVPGKTSEEWLALGIKKYLERLKHYATVEWIELSATAGKSARNRVPQSLGDSLLKKISKEDFVVLLDERGKAMSSIELAEWIQKKMNAGTRSLCLVVGDAYGFTEEVKNRADFLISFSRMTFSHEMIRVFMLEQLYRAFTILKNENYHHD